VFLSKLSKLCFSFWVSPEQYRGDFLQQNDMSIVHCDYPQLTTSRKSLLAVLKVGLQLYDSLTKHNNFNSNFNRHWEHVLKRKSITTMYQVMLKSLITGIVTDVLECVPIRNLLTQFKLKSY
jgi:hypothetical protein